MDVIKLVVRLTGFLLRLLWRLLFFILRRLLRLKRKPARKGASHGSARWATCWEQLRHGALTGEGVILGKGAFGRLLRFSSDGMIMVFAAMGAGKGLGIVIPALLAYTGSMLVTDPKGENYDITHRKRREYGKVRMLNPADLAHSDRYNPMDIIRRGTPMEADDAASLAALMVKPDARESHWDDKAISLLKALILHTLSEPAPSRTLANVRRLSIGSPELFKATLTEIADESPSLAAREIAAGFLTSAGGNDGSFSTEFSSILSNVQKATEPWSSGSPGGQLSQSSTFDLSELTTETVTLYLCVDEDLLATYERWLRVMVGCTLKTLTRAKTKLPKRKVVLLLDEVAILGRLDVLERQSGILRAYCTPVLIWQSLNQITKIYGEDAKAFLANASARVFFGTNDNDTAHYVATMVGQTTTYSHSTSNSATFNTSQSRSESGYWLIDPSEVQRLPLTRIIVKFRNVPYSILGRRIDYRKMRRWRGWWDRWGASRPSSVPSERLLLTHEAPQDHGTYAEESAC